MNGTEQDLVGAFHKHLDECRQCREHPFALCPVGGPLLEKAATGAPLSLMRSIVGVP